MTIDGIGRERGNVGLAEVKDDLRRLSMHHVRGALITATDPVRMLDLPVAAGTGRPSERNRPVYGIRETGTFRAQPVAFGVSMADRPYDQNTVVLRIDGGEATFRNLHALDADRRVLYEDHLTMASLPIALQRLEPVEEEHESVVYLSNTLPHNFYHWLIFMLPLLRFYEAAGVDVDHVYLGAALKDWQVRSLDFVGLDPAKFVARPCRAETAHVAVVGRPLGGVPPATIDWARQVFVPEEPTGGDRRLFLGRGQATTRRLLDEESLAEALEREFGFEYVTTSELTFDEEIELFGQADAVISPHGAALTNTLFSPRGVKILELIAFDNDYSVAHCYQEISATLGHRHGVIRGERTQRKKRGVNSDVKVPLDVVLRETEKMLSS